MDVDGAGGGGGGGVEARGVNRYVTRRSGFIFSDSNSEPPITIAHHPDTAMV
jgi:hypothetical protein